MREATVAYMSADATYDWPDWNARVEDTHGFGTAGLRRGDPLNTADHPATGVDSVPDRPSLPDETGGNKPMRRNGCA